MKKLLQLLVVALLLVFLTVSPVFSYDDFVGISNGPNKVQNTVSYEFFINGASKTVTCDAVDLTDAEDVSIQIYESNGYVNNRVWAAGVGQALTNAYTWQNLLLKGVPLVSRKELGSCTKTFWLEGKVGVRSATYGSADNIIQFSTIPIMRRYSTYIASGGVAIPSATTIIVPTGTWLPSTTITAYGIAKTDPSGLSQIRLRCSGRAITGVTQVVVISKRIRQ